MHALIDVFDLDPQVLTHRIGSQSVIKALTFMLLEAQLCALLGIKNMKEIWEERYDTTDSTSSPVLRLTNYSSGGSQRFRGYCL